MSSIRLQTEIKRCQINPGYTDSRYKRRLSNALRVTPDVPQAIRRAPHAYIAFACRAIGISPEYPGFNPDASSVGTFFGLETQA